jgi:predicted transcriptional regulator YdeE
MFQLNSKQWLEPRIVTLEQPIWIAGLSMKTSLKRTTGELRRLSTRLEALIRKNPIPDLKEPPALTLVSKGFYKGLDKGTSIIGHVINSFHQIPGVYYVFEIPAITYALFTIRPPNRFSSGMALSRMRRYSYNDWLPSSEYEQAGIIDDFEYHDERSSREKNPEIDFYLAIRKKSSKN